MFSGEDVNEDHRPKWFLGMVGDGEGTPEQQAAAMEGFLTNAEIASMIASVSAILQVHLEPEDDEDVDEEQCELLQSVLDKLSLATGITEDGHEEDGHEEDDDAEEGGFKPWEMN